MLPQASLCTASIAATPYRVASTRSNADGVPPRWTWPSSTTLVSRPDAILDLGRDQVGDAAEADVSEPVVDLLAGPASCLPLGRRLRRPPRSMRTDRVRGGARRISHTLSMSNGCSGMRITRRAPGDARVSGDPARMTTHHLDHHHPVVALGRGVQAVDGVGGDLHRGVEAERGVGADDVVVDGLGHADDRQAEVLAAESTRNRQRTVAADDDQRVEPHVGERLEHPFECRRRGRTGCPAWCRAACRPWAACRERADVERHRASLDAPRPRHRGSR